MREMSEALREIVPVIKIGEKKDSTLKMVALFDSVMEPLFTEYDESAKGKVTDQLFVSIVEPDQFS